MATELVMPKLSDTMKEGSIVRWLKKEGDPVQAGEVIAEIQSDKATIEFEAYSDGVLQRIFVEADQTVPVGTKIALVTDEGEEAPQEGEPKKEKKETPSKAEAAGKEPPEKKPEEKAERKPPPKKREPPAPREPAAEEQPEERE